MGRRSGVRRDDGPGIERADGRTEWWRNGRRLKAEQLRPSLRERRQSRRGLLEGTGSRDNRAQADEAEESLMFAAAGAEFGF